jgi:hypothetical protein
MATKADALDQRAAAQLDVEIIPGTEVMVSSPQVQFIYQIAIITISRRYTS